MLHPRAIIQRSCDVVVQESNLSSPPRATNPLSNQLAPVRLSLHALPSSFPDLFLCLDALEIVPNLGPRASSSFLTLPSWFIQRCNGKNKGEPVSGPVQNREPNRLSRLLPPPLRSLPRAEIFVCTIRFSHLASVKFINGGKMEIFGRTLGAPLCTPQRYCSQRWFVIYEVLALGN